MHKKEIRSRVLIPPTQEPRPNLATAADQEAQQIRRCALDGQEGEGKQGEVIDICIIKLSIICE
jgi:hypothetical protein